MSSALRLSIIMVFLLATTALGLIAYSMNRPIPVATGHGKGVGASHSVPCRGTSAEGRYIDTRRRFSLRAVG